MIDTRTRSLRLALIAATLCWLIGWRAWLTIFRPSAAQSQC